MGDDDFLRDDLTRRRVRSRADSLRAHIASESRRVRRNWLVMLSILFTIGATTFAWWKLR
jgi:hypothetical protein